MEQLFSPWRDTYTTDVARTKHGDGPDSCIFCTQFAANDDDKHFIIKRTKHNVIMLNLYPYNAGHLLIIPKKHAANLDAFSTEERAELMELASLSTTILTNTLKAEGINLGMSLGKAAGAGIPEHAHLHAVPRWNGDTNFLPTTANVKQIATDMVRIYNELKTAFANHQ